MRTVLGASLRVYLRRYVAAALAVATSVGFIVAIGGLSSATTAGLTSGLDAPYRQAVSVVNAVDEDGVDELVAGGDAFPTGYAFLPVGSGGRTIDSQVQVGPISNDERFRWQELVSGRFPATRGEAVVDAERARQAGVEVGDTITIGTAEASYDVVGTVNSPSVLEGATVYVGWQDIQAWRDQLMINSVASTTPVATLERAYPTAEVWTADDWVASAHEAMSGQANVMSAILGLFATIAGFVAVLVIANTFSILFAQRRRDFALLRAVGATGRQLVRSVRVEALALGVVATSAGLLGGMGFALGGVALLRHFGSAPLGAASFGPSWLAGATVAGLLTTVIAAWLPTRQVARVSPLAALRPVETTGVLTGSGRVRTALGVVLLLGGSGLLAAAIPAHQIALMLAGGVAFSTGILALGPVLTPALLRGVGLLIAPVLGAVGRLAAGDTVRNPRRTAATTASLLVGVTLTTAMLTGMASTRSGLDAAMDADHPIDLALTSSEPVSAAMVEAVAGHPGVAQVATVEGVAADVDGTPLSVLAAPLTPPASEVLRAPLEPVPPGVIRLPFGAVQGAGESVRIRAADGGTARLRVEHGVGWGNAGLVSPETLATLAASSGSAGPAPYALWVRATDDADADELGGDLEVLTGAQLENGLADRAWVDLQLDVVTWSVVGLLGIAVVIALIGIGNTLGLSVVERARELALLRALGMTRRQLRRMLGTEAILLSMVATLLGTAIGVFFAWVGLRVMVDAVLDDVTTVLPIGQLAAVIVISTAAGLLACLLPARRAARISPAAGLSLD